MRIIDKEKKKLKIMEKLNNNKNNIVAGVDVALGLVHLFFGLFFPIVGLVALSLLLVVNLVCGIDVLWNEDKHNRRIGYLKENVDALQNVKVETLENIKDKLQDVKQQKPTTKYDKVKQKSLVKALIERKKLVTLALKEEGKWEEVVQEQEETLSL